MVGASSGVSIAAQDYNTLVGSASALYTTGSGGSATAIGCLAKAHSSGVALGQAAEARGISSVAIGKDAVATLDSQIMLGASHHRVYVNNDPVAALEVATKQYVDGKAPSPESDASKNTSFGLDAQSTLSGSDNTAVGHSAQKAIGAGTSNVAIGVETQMAGTGTANVAVGPRAQRSMAGGQHNVGVGFQAGYYTSTGVRNTGVGSSALQGITTGSFNVAVGNTVMLNAGIANHCTAIGNGALYTPKGTTAAATTSASYQTAVGTNSGAYSAGTGDGLVALGSHAVAHTGAVAVGVNTEARGVRSTAIGYGAIATLDNQIMLGTATERVDVPGTLYVKGVAVNEVSVQTAQPTDGSELWLDLDEPSPLDVIQVETMLADLQARLTALEAA